MDSRRFDTLTRALTERPPRPHSRRSVLALAAGALAGMADHLTQERGAAEGPLHRQKKGKKPKGCKRGQKKCGSKCIAASACCTSDECVYCRGRYCQPRTGPAPATRGPPCSTGSAASSRTACRCRLPRAAVRIPVVQARPHSMPTMVSGICLPGTSSAACPTWIPSMAPLAVARQGLFVSRALLVEDPRLSRMRPGALPGRR